MSTLNERIKELRKQKGLTQSQLADMVGVSDKAVSKWEVSETNPDISLLPKLAQIFETTIDYLLTGVVQEKEIIIKSPKEILFETDDVQYLDKISDGDLNIVEMYQHKLSNTFAYLVDNNKIRNYIKGKRTRYSNYNDYIPEILYLLLISNRLDKIKTFDFNDIGFADKNEITEEMLDEIGSGERVNEDTINYLLTIHCRTLISVNQGDARNTEKYHGYGNWQDLYPRFLDTFAKHKKWNYVKILLDLFYSIDEPAMKTYNEYKNRMYESERYYIAYTTPKQEYGYNRREVRVLEIKSSTLHYLLDAEQYELLEFANKINALINRNTISIEQIKTQKIDRSDMSLKEKLVAKYTKNYIFNWKSAFNNVEVNGPEKSEDREGFYNAFLKQYKVMFEELINENVINYMELLFRCLEEKNLKKMYELAVDNELDKFADVLMSGNVDNIISEGKNTFVYTSSRIDTYMDGNVKRNYTLYQMADGSWFDTRGKAYLNGLYKVEDVSVVPNDVKSGIKYFEKAKKELFNAWINEIQEELKNIRIRNMEQMEYQKFKQEITVDYLMNEINLGNIDNAIIKTCVRLESVLKFRYGYTGELIDMINSLFNGPLKQVEPYKPYDDEDNFYQEQLNKYYKDIELNERNQNWQKALTSLRRARNNVVHPEMKDVTFTIGDLKYCISIIEELDK